MHFSLTLELFYLSIAKVGGAPSVVRLVLHCLEPIFRFFAFRSKAGL